MRRLTAAHLKLLQFAQDGDSMFGAVPQMGWKEATVKKLFYELIDANMIEAGAPDERMLTVEQPTKFELVINMKTAKALALTVPRRGVE